MGVARALVGRTAFHSSAPVSTSKARMFGSSVPAMKTNPPPVTIGPPRLMDPQFPALGRTAALGMKPSGTSHRFAPVAKSIAAKAPHGGALHGRPTGES